MIRTWTWRVGPRVVAATTVRPSLTVSQACVSNAAHHLQAANQSIVTTELETLEAECERLRNANLSLNGCSHRLPVATACPHEEAASNHTEPPVNGITEAKDLPPEEPTLADLDRSIPQVDCELIASLIRCRMHRRSVFLEEKERIKGKVAAITRELAPSLSAAESMSRVGALRRWATGGLLDADTTALAPTSAETPVLVSPSAVATLSEEELDALRTTRPEYDDGFILLDCRTVNEVISWGLIEGAKVLPAHELFAAFHSTPNDFEVLYGFSKPRPEDMIICYCQFGPRSLMAAQILSWMGYRKVLHFRDGYYEWGKQYNLLLRRWMEHDKRSGNELRRVATFRAALEMQRDIAPEFNALPLQEAAAYIVDTTRSRGTLLVGEDLCAEAYQLVAELVKGLPESSPGRLLADPQATSNATGEATLATPEVRRPHQLAHFLLEATGMDPTLEYSQVEVGLSEAQAAAAQDPMRQFSGRGGWVDRGHFGPSRKR